MFQYTGIIYFCFLLTVLEGTYGSSSGNDNGEDALLPLFGNIEPVDESVDEWFDYLYANLREVTHGLDPLSLPSDSDTFTATLFNNTMDGFIFLGDGKVSGLSTIHRAGHMVYESNETETGLEIILGGGAALIDLEASYNTKFELGPFKHHFGLTLTISYISLEFVTDLFIHPSQIVFEHCGIEEISTMHIKLDGMGLADSRLFNLVGNALLEVLEEPLTNALSGVACKLIQAALNEAEIETTAEAETTTEAETTVEAQTTTEGEATTPVVTTILPETTTNTVDSSSILSNVLKLFLILKLVEVLI